MRLRNRSASESCADGEDGARGVAEQMRRFPDGVEQRENVLHLACERPGLRFAALAVPAAVKGPDSKVARKQGSGKMPGKMIAKAAVNKKEGRPRSLPPECERRAVFGAND